MTNRSRTVLALATALLLSAGVSVAALLGNLLGYPQISLSVGGNTILTSGALAISGVPSSIRLSGGVLPISITPFPGGFESFDVGINVDGSCALTGGIAGDDFILVGHVDLGGDVRSGTLLTGEVLEFGFLDGTTTTDLFDFRVEVTGGALADLYLNDDIGISIQSEGSDFAGDCSMDSQGEAKGLIGSIPPILPAEGCTPGYWKQKHHFDSWVNYDPTDSFASIFGRTVTGVTDLESALKAKGGGVQALTRHATASLLNVANGDVNVNAFATESDVIAAFQAAYDSGDYELTKNAFEELNEEGCPLN